jgi:hypothetical protein
MLIPMELLSCVVFLGSEQGGEKKLGRTAFFVSVPTVKLQKEARWVYIVTAKHCVEGKHSLFARLNDGAGTKDYPLPDGDSPHWFLFPDDAGHDYVDLAMTPWHFTEEALQAGYKWVPSTMFFDEALLSDKASEGVGIGDEVAAMGLLSIHSGQNHNETVVRSGHLSLIPTERVWVDEYMAEMELYLAEINLTGGMSGAPVFARHRHKIGTPSPVSLMGLWIGHWKADGGHSGVGMVTPAKLINETLYRPDMIESRAKVERGYMKEHPPTEEGDAHDEYADKPSN